ncbi:MAG TPA: hypothetical protein VGP68_06480, partial [Gemmataceae bacterium]|jgi:hypothetical protein|nr:hypothetical protein [Gemmataceae bacterium]
MHGFLRTSTLVLMFVFLAVALAGWNLWPREAGPMAVPLPVAANEQEIAWLYPATNTAAWERFVYAVKDLAQSKGDEEDALSFVIGDQAFPQQTAVTPQLDLSSPDLPGNLSIRWYKLTGDQDASYWTRLLLDRQPPPLAIVGGSTSSAGIELAQCLEEETGKRQLGERAPLLLLTTATADDLPASHPNDPALTSVYGGRTFRFCFTNGQMAHAVTDFLRNRADLWPDMDPVYMIHWRDDPYSRDLSRRFLESLRQPASIGATGDWARAAAIAAGSGPPFDMAHWLQGPFRLDTPASWGLPHSIGTFDRPNRLEVAEASRLMRMKLEHAPLQRQPLLILPGASGPARRFLVALRRASPDEARHFVVATGDAIAFNTIFRDRNIAWPIQDLPFRLVLFCHRNPVDREAGFPLDLLTRLKDSSELKGKLAGTEDLLLFNDLVDALGFAWRRTLRQPDTDVRSLTAGAFAQAMRETRWRRSVDRVSDEQRHQLFFDEHGNRRSGTGEHVVYLRPVSRGNAQLAEAILEVWAWQTSARDGRRSWLQRTILPVYYDGSLDQEPGF